MYAIILSGQVECEIGDGTLRRWGSEDVVLQEDLTEQGYANRVVDDQPLMVAFVRT